MNDTVITQKNVPFNAIPGEIKSFLESLLADAGMTTLDEQTREEMVKELYVRLDHYLTNTIIENMPPAHLEEFVKMNESKKSMDEVQEFLISKMPDAQGVFVKAFDDFRNLYLSSVNLNRDKDEPEINHTPLQNDENKDNTVN